MKIGTFIFYKNIPLFSSWAQRFWTNTIYSHMSVYLGKYIGGELEFDADLLVRIHGFRASQNMDFVSWSNEVSEKVISEVLQGVIKEYEGRVYGFISWLTIFIRFGLQKLGFKNMHKKKFYMEWGVTCTELMYPIMMGVIKKMMEYYYADKWNNLYQELREYNPDTFIHQDAKDLMIKHPQCFKEL